MTAFYALGIVSGSKNGEQKYVIYAFMDLKMQVKADNLKITQMNEKLFLVVSATKKKYMVK